MAEFELHNAGNSEAQQKEALSRLFAQVGNLAAPGVLDGLVVSQAATANGTVLIAVGSCVLHPTMTAGASLLMNDTIKTLNIFTANPVGGLPRNDIVVFDSLTASISAIIGTPNAVPTDPTVPNTSLALARLRHAASATTIPTAKIDTLIVATRLRGVPPAKVHALTSIITGVGPTSSTTELVLATAPAVVTDGVMTVEVAFSWYNVTLTVGSDTMLLTLYDGPTAGSGTRLAQWLLNRDANGGSGHIRARYVPSAAGHTYTARLARLTGSGTASLSTSATAPAVLSVTQVIP